MRFSEAIAGNRIFLFVYCLKVLIMNHISIQYYKSPFGELIIGSFEEQLVLCDWRYRKMRDAIDKRLNKALNSQYLEELTPVIKRTIDQVEAYSRKQLKAFDLPLHLIGSDFQVKVWSELLKIPYGQTITYLELSKRINNTKAIRAVASANGANAISIIVPCHRIIGSNNKLVGYAGGLLSKKKLLDLENNSNTQLSIFK